MLVEICLERSEGETYYLPKMEVNDEQEIARIALRRWSYRDLSMGMVTYNNLTTGICRIPVYVLDDEDEEDPFGF